MILLAPTLALAVSTPKPAISVEAEYGDSVVEGSRYTAAHHSGKWRGNPAPCCDTAIPIAAEGETILVSHLDLDTVGGCARALGKLPQPESKFWALAQFVDLNGPHKVGQFEGLTSVLQMQLAAYHAWAESRPRLPRDIVADVTGEVSAAIDRLEQILGGEAVELAPGIAWLEKKAELNAKSLVRLEGETGSLVAVRSSESFVNHLYDYGSGIADSVVASNDKTGAVTVSFADPPAGANARDIVQALWGKDAGGHPGIAGSPRGRKMAADDLDLAAKITVLVMKTKAKKVVVERSPNREGVVYAFIDNGDGVLHRHVLVEPMSEPVAATAQA